jgi:repressor LexA
MPTTELTARQRQVLELVERSVEGRGYPPSLRELASSLRLSGTRAVEKHLAALERKGRLKRGHGSRALELTDRPSGRSIPIVGRVAAGAPILAEENREGSLTLDSTLARWPGCFLLRVKGESMRLAGILDGDLVLVKPQASAENGEIVVARLDDEATVKRFFKKKDGTLELQPENPAFAPISVGPEQSFGVLGKVVGVLRLPG